MSKLQQYEQVHGYVGDGRTRLQVATENLARAVREYDDVRALEKLAALTPTENRVLRMAANVAGKYIYKGVQS